MQTYQCHKRVQAAKIVAISVSQNGITLTYDDGHGETIYNDDKRIARYSPAVGDYLVEYEDGYQSFSPAKAFEDGYTLVQPSRPNPAHGAPKPPGYNPVA